MNFEQALYYKDQARRSLCVTAHMTKIYRIKDYAGKKSCLRLINSKMSGEAEFSPMASGHWRRQTGATGFVYPGLQVLRTDRQMGVWDAPYIELFRTCLKPVLIL